MVKVAVVILNWNGKQLLEKFLPNVVKFNPAFSEIIVADNASTDDSVSFLKQNYPAIKIISNATNGGYAKGYNDVLKKINAEYVILLNSDVEVTERWIEPIIELMDSDSAIAACQPKILSYNEKHKFEYAGAAGGFIDKYGYPFCRGRIFDSFEDDKGQYNDVKEILWATGACLFVRSSAFNLSGGLDEDFFAHMEEIDLCWRMKNMGYKIKYVPNSTVYHLGAGTLSKASPHKTYLNFRNNLILLCKNHAHQFFWIKLIIRMLLDGVAGIKFLLSNEGSHTLAVLKAHYSFYSTFSKTLAKRLATKKNIKVYATSAIYNRSIVVDYFLRKKKKFSELSDEYFG